MVAFAQACIVIGDLVAASDQAGAKQAAVAMTAWLAAAADALADPAGAAMRGPSNTSAGNL